MSGTHYLSTTSYLLLIQILVKFKILLFQVLLCNDCRYLYINEKKIADIHNRYLLQRDKKKYHWILYHVFYPVFYDKHILSLFLFYNWDILMVWETVLKFLLTSFLLLGFKLYN